MDKDALPDRISPPARTLRRLLAGGVALGALAAVYLLLVSIDAAIALWQRLQALPVGFTIALAAGLVVITAVSAVLIHRLLRPRARRAAAPVAIDRVALEARIARLEADDAAPLHAELVELQRRSHDPRVQIALFGEVSSGKSSLVRALVPDADLPIDARAGSTRQVTTLTGTLPDGRELVIADLPGSNEWTGEARAEAARDEVARCHAIVFVCSGEPTRSEDAELQQLAGYGRPLLLALNKSDRYDAAQLALLRERLRQRYAPLGAQLVEVSAGYTEEIVREWPDGRRDSVTRARPPQIAALQAALSAVATRGAAALEPARAAATLARLDVHVDATERRVHAQRADAIVRRYTRRAVIGALAAVAPGTDLLIQGALATALVRELAALHGVGVRDVDLDGLVERIGSTARATSSIALAIAGNALKAFPGFGTLTGGLVHAVAYGLIFDSLGRAVAQTLATTRALDREATTAAFRAELERPSAERLQMLARLAWEGLQQPPDDRTAAGHR